MDRGALSLPAGLALHLTGRDGRRRCLGGRNVRPWSGAPLGAQPVEAVDGYLSREDFADLLREVAASLAPIPDEGALRFPLVPNGASHVLRNLAAPQTAALIAEIDASELTLFDAKTGARVASAPRSAIQLERAAHVYPGKERGLTMAALVLRAPGVEPLFIGVPDPRFKWRGIVATAPEPTYQSVRPTGLLWSSASTPPTRSRSRSIEGNGQRAASSASLIEKPLSPGTVIVAVSPSTVSEKSSRGRDTERGSVPS